MPNINYYICDGPNCTAECQRLGISGWIGVEITKYEASSLRRQIPEILRFHSYKCIANFMLEKAKE